MRLLPSESDQTCFEGRMRAKPSKVHTVAKVTLKQLDEDHGGREKINQCKNKTRCVGFSLVSDSLAKVIFMSD